MKQVNQELIEDKKTLEGEKDEVTRYAQELVEKVKKEDESRDFMIDRRMINTFLIQFANPKSDEKTKHLMLDAMSKILVFTMEEKETLGLIKKPKVEETKSKAESLKQVSSSLVSFLMGDDDFD